MKKGIFKKSLKNKMIICFTSIGVVPIIILSSIYSIMFDNVISKSVIQETQTNLKYIMANVDKQLEMAGKISLWFSSNKHLDTLLTKQYANKLEANIEVLTFNKYAQEYILNSFVGNNISKALIIGNNGLQFQIGDETSVIDSNIIKQQDWFKTYKNTQVTQLVRSPDKYGRVRDVFPLAAAIVNNIDGETIGWNIIFYKSNLISDVFKQFNIPQKDELFIINSNGQCLGHTQPQYIGTNLLSREYVKDILHNDTYKNQNGYIEKDIDGIKCVINYYKHPYKELILMQTSSLDLYYSGKTFFMNITIITLIVTVIASIGSVIFLSFRLTKPIKNNHWTNGFYTGILWLCYEYTKDEIFKQIALENVDSFKERLDKEIALETHDLGFLYSLSCVASYKITGDEKSKLTALRAADLLRARYREKGEFIQAWGSLDAEDNFRLIIDCLLNLPLLYWASKVTKDQSYYDIAYTHAKTTLKYIIREDNSTFHTYFFDKKTGKPAYGATCQGYNDNSAWARGQAWGIYGTALSYIETWNEKFMDDFLKLKDYFIDNLPKDHVPYWDLIFKDGEEPRDSSSAAIAVCGMNEMARHIKNEEQIKSLNKHINKIMISLINNYSVSPNENSNGLIYHSTYSKKTPYNTCTPEGVDECVIWGDYFYMEALMRMWNEKWEMYW